MGYDIGFVFQKQDNFNQGCDNFFKKHPKIDPAFGETIKEDRIWIELLIGVRNNIIDHKVGKDPAFIERLSRFLNLETAEIMFENCWKSMEDFLIVFANDITNPKYGLKILELTEYKNNKNHPERFGWFDMEKK